MSSEKHPKRVVSKLEYVGHLGKKGSLYSAGVVLYCIGAVGLVVDFLLALGTLFALLKFGKESGAAILLIGAGGTLEVIVGGLCYSLMLFGGRGIATSDNLEPVIPLTRQNAAQMPAEDSLVRASAEPTTPSDTLLRAANVSVGAPQEELLRATAVKPEAQPVLLPDGRDG